jgi:hypothetical protein
MVLKIIESCLNIMLETEDWFLFEIRIDKYNAELSHFTDSINEKRDTAII